MDLNQPFKNLSWIGEKNRRAECKWQKQALFDGLFQYMYLPVHNPCTFTTKTMPFVVPKVALFVYIVYTDKNGHLCSTWSDIAILIRWMNLRSYSMIIFCIYS